MVLLIEDDEATLYALDRLIRRGGYVPLPAASGAEALDLLGQTVPRVIVLDWRLPDIGGSEVLRRIRADRRFAQVPVLIYSAYVDDDAVNRQAMADGATECVPKGASSTDALMAVLARYAAPAHRC